MPPSAVPEHSENGRSDPSETDRYPHSLACAAGLDEEGRYPSPAPMPDDMPRSHPSPTRERGNPSCIFNKTAAILESTDETRPCRSEQDWSCRLLLDHFCGVMSNANSFGPLAVTSARRGDSFGRPNFSGVTCHVWSRGCWSGCRCCLSSWQRPASRHCRQPWCHCDCRSGRSVP